MVSPFGTCRSTLTRRRLLRTMFAAVKIVPIGFFGRFWRGQNRYIKHVGNDQSQANLGNCRMAPAVAHVGWVHGPRLYSPASQAGNTPLTPWPGGCQANLDNMLEREPGISPSSTASSHSRLAIGCRRDGHIRIGGIDPSRLHHCRHVQVRSGSYENFQSNLSSWAATFGSWGSHLRTSIK